VSTASNDVGPVMLKYAAIHLAITMALHRGLKILGNRKLQQFFDKRVTWAQNVNFAPKKKITSPKFCNFGTKVRTKTKLSDSL